MTDTKTFEIDETTDSQVRQWFKRLYNKTAEIDEKVDAGSEAATERKFRNQLVDEAPAKAHWEGAVANLVQQLDAISQNENMEVMVGTYLGLQRGIQRAMKEKVDEFVNKYIAAQPAPEQTEQISAEEKTALMKERSELVKQLKTIKEMATTFGEIENEADWPMPVSRRGAPGTPRGPRVLYTYTWSIDGQELPDDDNDPKGVAKALGFAKVGDFTDWMKVQTVGGKKFNTTKPPTSFTMEYNGHTIAASEPEDEEEDEETPAEPTE